MRYVLAIVLGQLVAQLGWIDPIYLPLVLVAPPVSAAVAAARGVPLALVVLFWASAGVNMLWLDYVLYREDVVYHVALTVVMSGLAALGYGVVALVTRRRTISTQT